MGAELVVVLLEATVAATAAVALVLALRRPMRRVSGARAAYLLWLCVPVATVAVLVPNNGQATLPAGTAWLAPVQVAATGVIASAAGGWLAWQDWLLPLWLAGAAATAAVMVVQQRRFQRALGPLTRRADGLYQCAHATAGLPAVVGVLRPRILLPADFEQRYSARERELIVAHERLHVRRADLLANAVAALLRCLFWFHPLFPVALRRFRQDQELACDASVIACHPGDRRAYGEAMLKTQLYDLSLPLGCHWPLRHPIKERIEMLKHPVSSPRRTFATALCALGLVATSGFAAWAAQPAPAAAVAAASTQALAAGAGSPDGSMRHADEQMPPPRYPKAAAEAKVSGVVTLLVSVAADGSVTDVEVERATPQGVFEAVAVEAARQWKFTPAMEDGKPVPARVRVPIEFDASEHMPAGGDEGGQA